MDRVEPQVTRRTRRGVHAFLIVFALTGVFRLELFPFTGFRLFSEIRTDVRESWQLRAVGPAGDETPIRLAELPLAFRNTTRLLLEFEGLSQAARDAVCDAWAQPRRDSGATVTGVRVYAVVESVRPGGDRPRRRLAYECGSGP